MYIFLNLISIHTIIKTCTKHDIRLEILDWSPNHEKSLRLMNTVIVTTYLNSVVFVVIGHLIYHERKLMWVSNLAG